MTANDVYLVQTSERATPIRWVAVSMAAAWCEASSAGHHVVGVIPIGAEGASKHLQPRQMELLPPAISLPSKRRHNGSRAPRFNPSKRV